MIGVHITSSTYGTWLPGDARGHWSPYFDESGRFIYPCDGPLPGNERVERFARQRMAHDAVVLSEVEQSAVADGLGAATRDFGYTVYAAAVRPTHFHLVIGFPADPIGRIAGRYKGVAGARVRRIRGPGPIRTDGYYKVYLDTGEHLETAVAYVEAHNTEIGLPARRWDWIMPRTE